MLDHHGCLGDPDLRLMSALARIGAKATRLKLNGYLLARSPLSSLEELEMLRLGVEGKAGARAASAGGPDTRLDPDRLDEVVSRARRQTDLLEELRVYAAGQVDSKRQRSGDA